MDLMGKTSRDKLLPSGHYCRTPVFGKYEGRVWSCNCGAIFKCKLVRGRLVWLQTRDGRKQ
jgi:hypothetical protein